ncbi:unnamed protein product [Zymoseptoria tritici ST99CH_1E4]|uniref:Carboxylesterase type B domain-containing protein n=1 Tax=Zymoseptoria tritici ST99CH_1E4 TaxID=1276532 RepID=A0A2H1FZH4_ZYMTR|nr:unnamed protein product [Zymoseptoria tritici ST99CH_1E4]
MASNMKIAIAGLSLLVANASAWSIPSVLQRSQPAAPNPKYGQCIWTGALMCNGLDKYGICSYGSVVWKDVAPGTTCQDINGFATIVNMGDGKCEKDGKLTCHGHSMFGLCDKGTVKYHTVAAGSFCENDQIVAAGSYAIRESTRSSNATNQTATAGSPYTIPGSPLASQQTKTNGVNVAASPVPHGNSASQPAYGNSGPPASNGNSGSPASCGYPGGPATATLDAGVIHGTSTSLPSAPQPIVNKFLGVPFAAPPKRFSPPEKPQSWPEPIDVTSYKPACIQQFSYPKVRSDFAKSVFNTPAPEESEDCLYLNVYSPSSPAPADGRSVLFWIYGGSLEFGNAGNANYDGSILAAYQDVIVVTVNYRTNVFGFASSDEIPLDQRNLGFYDQRLGLDWVQRNIAAFGGSPNKVTLFGESAGSFSIDALLTSYSKDDRPPFRGAILESGQISYSASANPSTVPAWNQLAASFNCPESSTLECLRNVPATDIKKYIEENALHFNYAFDGVTAFRDAANRRKNGQIAKIPILIGSNAQEGRIFQVGQNSQEASRAYIDAISGNQTAYGNMIEAAFPLGSPGITSYYDQISQINTEYRFQCGSAKVANDSAASGIPAWRYYFNASFPNTQKFPQLGVYHASEIPIVFGTYPRTNVTTQQYALSTAIMGMWARFAKNPKSGPGWNPVATGVASEVLVGSADVGMGGMYIDGMGMPTQGAYDLAVLGNRHNVLSSGVTVIDQSEVDYRCAIFEPAYAAILSGAGT